MGADARIQSFVFITRGQQLWKSFPRHLKFTERILENRVTTGVQRFHLKEMQHCSKVSGSSEQIISASGLTKAMSLPPLLGGAGGWDLPLPRRKHPQGGSPSPPPASLTSRSHGAWIDAPAYPCFHGKGDGAHCKNLPVFTYLCF